MKICIVSSVGGHLTEVRLLREIYEKFEHFYVLNDEANLSDDMLGKTYFIKHSERDGWFFLNLLEALSILYRERPEVILSTGAGPVVPFALVGKLFGVKCIYIESMTRIHEPSLAGKLMYWLADDFFYQWPELAKELPKATYGGPIL